MTDQMPRPLVARLPVLFGVLAIAVVVVTTAALAFAPIGNRAAAGVATLWVHGGTVYAQTSDAQMVPAATGQRLSVGEVVRAQNGARGLIRFADGTTVELESGAELRLAKFAFLPGGIVNARVEQRSGRLLLDARVVSGVRSVLEVVTPAATARGEGAAFTVSVEGDGALVRVVRGTVTFGTRTVFPEMESHATVGAAASLPAPVRPGPGIEFIAKNATLSVIDPLMRLTQGLRRADLDAKRAEDRVYLGPQHFGDAAALGQYTIVARSGDGGDVALDLAGLHGISLTNGTTRSVRLEPGGVARTTVRVSLDPAGRVVFAEPTPLVPVTSACAAEAVEKAFAEGTVEERARDLEAYARGNRGKRVSLVLSDAEVARLAGGALSSDVGATLGLRDVTTTVDADGVRLAAHGAFGPLNVSARADLVLPLRDGAPAVSVNALTVEPFAALFADSLARQLERSLTEALAPFATGSIVWDRLSLHGGCVGLFGTAR